jgi:hypothetical protein
MKIEFRITRDLLQEIHNDLDRPHPVALERVGYISCACARLPNSSLLLLAQKYHPVADTNYLPGLAGATINSAAIRQAMTIAFTAKNAIFHVHRHEHLGRPRFSHIDARENAKLVPDFFKVRPELPHGALVFSHDSAYGMCWFSPQDAIPIDTFKVVGSM